MTTLAVPGADRPGPRPAVPGRMVTTLVFARRAVLKLKHVPEQMIDAIAIPVLFTVLFTYCSVGRSRARSATICTPCCPALW
jgi:hypothetical protein